MSSEGIGACGWMLFAVSWLLVAVTLPFSLCVLLKVQYNTIQYSTVQSASPSLSLRPQGAVQYNNAVQYIVQSLSPSDSA